MGGSLNRGGIYHVRFAHDDINHEYIAHIVLSCTGNITPGDDAYDNNLNNKITY